MEFSQEVIEKIQEYLKNPKFIEIIKKLGIYKEEFSENEKIESIKQYIYNELRGKFYLDRSINKFFELINYYMENNNFKYSEDEYAKGFIDYNFLLPIKEKGQANRGLRIGRSFLGLDGFKYIEKQAEGLKGPVSGMKNKKDALYNSTVAQAVFEYLEEPCAEYLPAFEKPPYYYVLSKNFLKPNQKMHKINDEEFMETTLQLDENNNVTHSQIMEAIQETVIRKYHKELTEEELRKLCNKLKLQYAIQETIKKFISSMDENLGNTSIVITQDSERKMIDLNISPAYDLDLSFALGEEILGADYTNQIFYRISNNGKTDLTSMINEFKNIIGYEEKINQILNKLSDNYAEKILNIAYNNSKVEAFNNKALREKYTSFLMAKVAELKAAWTQENLISDKKKSE